jgi:hypothetical protein
LSIEIIPATAALGAKVSGVELAQPLNPSTTPRSLRLIAARLMGSALLGCGKQVVQEDPSIPLEGHNEPGTARRNIVTILDWSRAP